MFQKKSKPSSFAVFFVFSLIPLCSYGELKDPTFRDEDISATQVNVNIERISSGFYEYVYYLQFPKENIGSVASIKIDLSCNGNFEEVIFPEPDDPDSKYLSNDGKFTPVQIYDSYGAMFPAVTPGNMAYWGFANGRPGTRSPKLRLISPASPVLRGYEIRPSMDTFGWDYPELEEHPEIPWIEDFMVTGLIEGPGCDPEKPSPLYAGSKRGVESDDDNQLLTYRQPTRNRWHAEPGDEFLTLEVVYSERVDPKSFKVTPGWAKQYFSPNPGAEETVSIPLRSGVNKVKLEARTEKEKPQGGGRPEFSRKDMDEFEVRLPTKGKGSGK